LQRLHAAFRRTLGLTDAADEAYWGYAVLGLGAAAVVVLAYVLRRRRRR
jgi:LPXTG-motif cell wall-anchored protein